MKRYFLAAFATTMLAVPVMSAQAAPISHQVEYQYAKTKAGERVGEKKTVRKVVRTDRHGSTLETQRLVNHRWVGGQSLPHWQRDQIVRDYRHYGLHRPGRGQHWVKVNNDYLLVGVASGAIAGFVVEN